MQTQKLRYADDLARFLARLHPQGVVVDALAGQGFYTKEFLQRGYNVYAFGGAPGEFTHVPNFTDMIKTPHTDIDQTLIPHRTVAGVWATESLQTLDKRSVHQRLSLFIDWLQPQGVCSFVMREGEGKKKITDHGLAATSERTLYLYQPSEIEDLVVSAGLRTVDAWRDGNAERTLIHVIAERPMV